MKTNTTTITHAAVIFAEVPFTYEHQQYGLRPCLVISNNACCKFSPVVQIVPLTSRVTKKHLPVHVEVAPAFLSKPSIVLAEQLMLVSREILTAGRLCGTLDDESMSRVHQALKIQLALD